MKIVGLIAEYNPFHNGHLYHIQKARELTGADYVIVVMSGDFVQRGTPAVYDKYTRTRMALKSGADLVLELPVRDQQRGRFRRLRSGSFGLSGRCGFHLLWQ